MYFYSLDEITGTARLIKEIKRWVGAVNALINLNILRVLFCPAIPGGVLHASRDFRLNKGLLAAYIEFFELLCNFSADCAEVQTSEKIVVIKGLQ